MTDSTVGSVARTHPMRRISGLRGGRRWRDDRYPAPVDAAFTYR